jgi:hypothetical protein
VRDPWWRVPYLRPADLFLTYMNADTPRFAGNLACAHHLNSVHGIYLSDSLRDDGIRLLPLASLNSATLLGAETVGRAYGGGLLKIEPGEADLLPVPSIDLVRKNKDALLGVRQKVAAQLRAPQKTVNPWSASNGYEPDYATLQTLLAVPLHLNANTQSGVPALALDVWVAYELRRARLDPDAVWPRAEAPRVVDRDILKFVSSVPKKERDPLLKRLRKGSGAGGVATASANILGKNYLKQVDVIMTSWQTGPELLISTKRMDSSFGKNAANRVEESYGDAKNLALRHPLAALGFVYSLRSTAYTEERKKFDWLVDLLIKLGREDDAYDACTLIVPEWEGAGPADDEPAEAPMEPDDLETEDAAAEESEADDVDVEIGAMPTVILRHDLVPDELGPARFFRMMLDIVLTNSTVAHHQQARDLRAKPRP